MLDGLSYVCMSRNRLKLTRWVGRLGSWCGRVGSWCGSSWQLVWAELAVDVGQTGSWCGVSWQLVWGKLEWGQQANSNSSLLCLPFCCLDLITLRPSQQELVSSPDPPCPYSLSSYFLPDHMTSGALLLSPVCWSLRCLPPIANPPARRRRPRGRPLLRHRGPRRGLCRRRVTLRPTPTLAALALVHRSARGVAPLVSALVTLSTRHVVWAVTDPVPCSQAPETH